MLLVWTRLELVVKTAARLPLDFHIRCCQGRNCWDDFFIEDAAIPVLLDKVPDPLSCLGAADAPGVVVLRRMDTSPAPRLAGLVGRVEVGRPLGRHCL